MQTRPYVPIIGGSRHGQNIQVDKETAELVFDVHTAGPPTPDSTITETYQRRIFAGEEFGEGYECFVLKSDDETEQRELARWSLLNLSAKAANGGD